MWKTYQSEQFSTSFKDQIKLKIEHKLKESDPVFKPDADCDIVSIFFAFKNRPIIENLKKRGTLVAYGKLNKIDEVEQDLNNIIEQKFDHLTTPVYAYITFQTCEAQLRACRYLSKTVNGNKNQWHDKEFKLFGENVNVEQAPPPDNIIWENSEIKGRVKLWGLSKVSIITVSFLVLAFIFFVFLKSFEVIGKRQYPLTNKQCDAMALLFKGEQSEDIYFRTAQVDREATEHKHGLGYYQCYCLN